MNLFDLLQGKTNKEEKSTESILDALLESNVEKIDIFPTVEVIIDDYNTKLEKDDTGIVDLDDVETAKKATQYAISTLKELLLEALRVISEDTNFTVEEEVNTLALITGFAQQICMNMQTIHAKRMADGELQESSTEYLIKQLINDSKGDNKPGGLDALLGLAVLKDLLED